jgi:hypothetical protein
MAEEGTVTVSTQRIRVKGPDGDINLDRDLGPANGWTKGAKGAATSAPAYGVGNMNPIIKGQVLSLKHLNGGKAASKAFRIHR